MSIAHEAASRLQKQGVSARVEEGYTLVLPNPVAEKAATRAEQMRDSFAQSGIDSVEALTEEVASMPISSRFSPTRRVNENLGRLSRGPYDHLTESEHRRNGLSLQAQSIRRELEVLRSRMGSLVMEMEAVRTEDSGQRL